MDYVICVVMGYTMGCVSPSYVLSKIKGVDIRKSGTKNLGASNTFMHFGRFWGIFVMLFDIVKAYTAVKLAQLIFPNLALSGIITGSAAVIGHNYPFYLRFKGGKGLAAFGGFVLAVHPLIFLFLLLCCTALALVFNYGFIIAHSAAILFPIIMGFYYESIFAFVIVFTCGASLFLRHTENLRRLKDGEEEKFREFIKKYVLKLSKRM